MPKPHLIFVGDGRTDDLLWVEIDGNSATVNPVRLKELIPEIATAVEVVGSDVAMAATVEARKRLRESLSEAATVIADSDSVCRVYTLDSGIQANVLERAKSLLAAG